MNNRGHPNQNEQGNHEPGQQPTPSNSGPVPHQEVCRSLADVIKAAVELSCTPPQVSQLTLEQQLSSCMIEFTFLYHSGEILNEKSRAICKEKRVNPQCELSWGIPITDALRGMTAMMHGL